MNDLFINLLNMSITASWLVLAVIALRFLLKKAPKWISTVLWAFVGFRLVCPFTFESVLSLIPSTETVPTDIVYSQSPAIHSGIPVLNSTINPIISETFAPDVTNSANLLQITTAIASVIWLVGIFAMILYAVISYTRLHKKVREGVILKENIWLCDRIDTPFILGVFKPRIFLPSGMAESDIEYVIAHENAHLRRLDHLWKPLGFILLTVYWFNPVMWIAYILLCRDIELACDEKVLKEMGAEIKKPYSEALINCSVSRRTISACPLAFGETGVKGRIKSVLSYKKPTLWIIIIAVISCIVVAVCFLTNPKPELKDSNPELDKAVSQAIIGINSSGDLYNAECMAEGHIIYGVEEEGDNVTVYLCEEFAGFGFKNGYFMEQTGHSTPAVFTFIKNDDGYVLLDYDYPTDGEKLFDSIKEMFPAEYVHRAFNVSERDYADMWKQCVAYAEDYLEKIDREAEIRDYSEVPHIMLTDVGVSVEVSNKIVENKSLSHYDSDIGNYETLEDGVRFVYRTDFDKDKNLIIFTKELYGEGKNATNQIIEKIKINSQTGDIVSQNSYPYEIPETTPEKDTYYSSDYLDYTKASDEVRNEYIITAIHYPSEGAVEASILIGEAHGTDVASFLDNVKWRRSLSPFDDLSSPGSVEFVIDENYRVTVYKRKKGSVFAYAVVKVNNEERYYHASYADYTAALATVHAPSDIREIKNEGFYSYSYITEKDSAYLSVNPELKTAFFSLSLLSSYVVDGTYEDYPEKIVVTSADNEEYYTFRKSGDNLIFDAEYSTAVPKYRYDSASNEETVCIPHGALFKAHGFQKTYIDKVYADIDNDGKKEDCIMGYGPTSGLFTVTFTAYEQGRLDYFNIFNISYQDLWFETDENGNAFIRCKGIDYKTQEETTTDYEISIYDGNVKITSDGNDFAYWGEQGVDSHYAPAKQ